jgi:hypothetical protein
MKALISFIAISFLICLLTVTILCIWNFTFINWQVLAQVVNTTCAVSGSLFVIWLFCGILLNGKYREWSEESPTNRG